MKILAIAMTLAIGGALAVMGPNSGSHHDLRFGTQAVRIDAIRFEQTDSTVTHAVRARPRVVHASRSYRSMGQTNFGRATWYSGRIGACGQPLTGMYVASRTLPCGTHVRLRYGGRSVVATVLDRGPISTSRDFDLCRSAFATLAPLSAGVIGVWWTLVA